MRKLILCAIWVSSLAAPRAEAAPMFMGLGDLDGIPGGPYEKFESHASAVSADGTVVVGTTYMQRRPADRSNPQFGDIPFRWTQATGMVEMEPVCADGGDIFCHDFVTGVSDDGAVTTGRFTAGDGSRSIPAIWHAGGEIEWLPLSTSAMYNDAEDASGDGSVVVGMAREGTDDYRAARWRWDGVAYDRELIEDILPGAGYSAANGVSSNGAIVIGEVGSVVGHPEEAFIWTEAGGMESLNDIVLSDDIFAVTANAISSDGFAVVGYGSSSDTIEAFLWTASGGLLGLGTLDGESNALAVSGDGSVVVGRSGIGCSTSSSGCEAFIWDEANGMRSIQDVLVNNLGLDLTGWTLYEAVGISDDGFTIVGTGFNPSGDIEAWIAIIPEPSTGLLLGLGLVGLGVGRRRRPSGRTGSTRPGPPTSQSCLWHG